MDDLSKKAGEVFWKHPLAFLAVAGAVVHGLLMCLTVNYDAAYWALVIRNIEAGEGLYGMDGYYYTPAWGYVLGLVSALQSVFMNIGEAVVRVPELIPVEGVEGFFLSATVPSLAFIWSVKLALMFCDLAMAWAVHSLVMERTGDVRRSAWAFGLTFMCPILLGSSCIVAMPDTLAVTCMVLAILLLMKGHHISAGAVFCIGAMVKFFPIFILPVLVGYIFRTCDGRRAAVGRTLQSAAGFLATAVVLFLPQLLSGSIDQCFQFLSDRTGDAYDDGILEFLAGKARIALYLAVTVIAFHLGYRTAKGRDPGRDLILHSLMLMTVCMLYPPAPQYLVVLVPLLVYWMVAEDRGCVRSWAVVSAGAMSFSVVANSMLLVSLAYGGGPVPPDLVLDIAGAYLGGGALVLSVFYVMSGAIQYIGVLMLALRLHGVRWRGSAGC